MCTIRLINRSSTSQNYDNSFELEGIKLNPIDKPAYVIYKYNNDTHFIHFVYVSDKEVCKKYAKNQIIIIYGMNSGRIYDAQIGKNMSINQTDKYGITSTADITFKTERFKNNIKDFIEICNKIISFVTK